MKQKCILFRRLKVPILKWPIPLAVSMQVAIFRRISHLFLEKSAILQYVPWIPMKLSLGKGPWQMIIRSVIKKSTRFILHFQAILIVHFETWMSIKVLNREAHALKSSTYGVKKRTHALNSSVLVIRLVIRYLVYSHWPIQ